MHSANGNWRPARKPWNVFYTPHSLRATAATLLLDSGVDIMEVKELLGHRHVTTTPIYDKLRRAAREGASHKMPL
jgi:site-specific recombinase XerD